MVIRRCFNKRHADPVDAEVSKQRGSFYEDLFREALQKRIEDERFYASQEWRIVREAFLRTQMKLTSRYVCHYCQKII